MPGTIVARKTGKEMKPEIVFPTPVIGVPKKYRMWAASAITVIANPI
jgi:hypothetical protein